VIPGHPLPHRPRPQRLAHVLAYAVALGIVGAAPPRAEAQDVRALAATCASCHQPARRAPPPLAGQPRDELLAKLRGFRNGTRSGTVMPQLANGYTLAELDALAGYFARQVPAR